MLLYVKKEPITHQLITVTAQRTSEGISGIPADEAAALKAPFTRALLQPVPPIHRNTRALDHYLSASYEEKNQFTTSNGQFTSFPISLHSRKYFPLIPLALFLFCIRAPPASYIYLRRSCLHKWILLARLTVRILTRRRRRRRTLRKQFRASGPDRSDARFPTSFFFFSSLLLSRGKKRRAGCRIRRPLDARSREGRGGDGQFLSGAR